MVTRDPNWTAQPWVNGPAGNTPITAARLTNIEDQVEGVTVDLNDVPSQIATAVAGINVTPAGGSSPSLYRGAWATEQLAYQADLSGNALPAGFTRSAQGYGVLAYLANISGLGNPLGTPGTNTRGIVLDTSGINPTMYTKVALNIAQLGLVNVTRLKVWFSHIQLSQSSIGFQITDINKNGTLLQTAQFGGAASWTQLNLTSDSDDVFEFINHSSEQLDKTEPTRLVLTGLEVYASGDPYMLNQVVSYNGTLYRSAANFNGSVPGVNSDWVNILTSAGLDAEAVRDTIGTTLRAGTGVTVTVNDAADTVTVAAVPQESNTPYKGEWRPLTEVVNYDFMTGISPWFTQTPRITLQPNPGGVGAPPQTQVVMIGYFNNAYNPFDGALQTQVPAGVNRVRFTWRAPSYNTYGIARFLKNGGVIKQTSADTGFPWTTDEYTVTEGDVLRWDTMQAFSSTNPIYMSSVVFLGPATTYNLHDVVSYGGQLWESSVNNNSETPGSGTLWVAVTDVDPDLVKSTTIDNIVTLTQAAYTALATKVATTLYVIVG